MQYKGTLFGEAKKVVKQPDNAGQLISIQANLLSQRFGTDCLDAKQLQAVLNVGETNVYSWLKKCSAVRVIGRRKVVPIISVANYLVTGNF